MAILEGAGNPLEIAFGGDEFENAYTNANGVRYEYDALSRLTNENWGHLSGGSWTPDHSDTWAYDWAGNRDPSSNTYNQADMLNVNDGYVYDYRGNLEYKPDNSTYSRTRFYYNPDNLLDRADDVVNAQTTNTTDITWDASYQRLKLARGSDTWEMVYDATSDNPAVLLSKDCVQSSTSYTFYVREPEGELLASFDAAGTPSYYHFDGLGSTVLVTDGSGSATDSFTYGAWGNVLNTPPLGGKPYQFVGGLGYYVHTSAQGSALAGMLQLGVRCYDPEAGRFTQRDPLPAALSRYAYVDDDPANVVDPTGMKPDFGNPPRPGPGWPLIPVSPEEAKKCSAEFKDCVSSSDSAVMVWSGIAYIACLGLGTPEKIAACRGTVTSAGIVAGLAGRAICWCDYKRCMRPTRSLTWCGECHPNPPRR